MTPEELQKSVVLITSAESNISRFGTGFVIRQESWAAYLVTCAHVVKDVGGAEKVIANGLPATVIAMGDDDRLDLAVLKVEGLRDKPPLKWSITAERGSSFITAGFQLFDKKHLIRPLQGTLGVQVGLESKGMGERIQAWDLRMADDYALQPGYSGSPVVDQHSGCVLGVVSHRQGDGRSGLAISIEALEKIWKTVDTQQLYRTLLKLGYQEQVRLFRKLIGEYPVAAFLIHGLPEYGQRWLLNRLVNQYIPNSVTSLVVKVNLSRKGRKINIDALWRELSGRVGLRGKQVSPQEIADRVYQWWQTQNVFLVIHDVNCMPEACMDELIQQFWLPLSSKARDARAHNHGYKLLMFLVDYEGCAEGWNTPFAARLDSAWKPQTPIRSPRLSEFSDNELINWIDNEVLELPLELTHEVDETVQAILERSNNGIPERVLEEICAYCGCNWYEESEQWLKL